ncbi:putative mitochondrial-processing peptidase subunit beta, mitochondrial isoform X2 [Wolffia australiana]
MDCAYCQIWTRPLSHNNEEDISKFPNMHQVEGHAEEVIFDHLHATAFQYTPLGRTILSSPQNDKTITQQHLLYYISTHYTDPRMVISATGAVKHQDIVAQVYNPTTASQLRIFLPQLL